MSAVNAMMEHAQDIDLAPANEIAARYPSADASALIAALQDVQHHYGYLPAEAVTVVARALSVPLANAFAVATFYHAFSLSPQGRVVVRVCTGTACHLRGAQEVLAEVQRVLAVGVGQTTPDREFTVQTVQCVGACAMAPLLMVGDKAVGNARIAAVREHLRGKGK